MLRRFAVLAVTFAAVAACGRRDGRLPPDLVIAVEIGGREAAPITAARLEGLEPDFRDAERRAWRLDHLLGEGFLRQDAVLEVEAAEGRSVTFEAPGRRASGEILVLAANRKGEVVLAQVDPDDPFPPFHGRGGGRGRAAEAQRRVRDVVRLRLRHGGAGGGSAAREEAMLDLKVVVDGEERTWTEDDLVGVDPLSVPGDSGEGARDAWSLRTLLGELVGPGAVLTTVAGEGGRSVEIPRAAWDDEARTPMLRLNRRGQLKFHWAGRDFVPLEGEEVRPVTRLVVRTR